MPPKVTASVSFFSIAAVHLVPLIAIVSMFVSNSSLVKQ